MSRDLDLVRSSIEDGHCVAAAAGIGAAWALTENELVTAKAGLFGRWGKRVDRYHLDRLTHVGHTPNSYGDSLCVQFDSSPDLRFTIRFEPWARIAFTPIIDSLKQRMRDRKAEAA